MLRGKQTVCKAFILRKVFHGAMKRALAWSKWPQVQILAPLKLRCFISGMFLPFYDMWIVSSPS